MGDLTEHFSRWEFACPCCGRGTAHRDLLTALERLRTEVGRPLRIVSGYRCVSHNARVGGIPTSLHLVGRAADIPRGYTHVNQVRRAGFHGVGIRAGRVIHVDVSEGGRFHTFRD